MGCTFALSVCEGACLCDPLRHYTVTPGAIMLRPIS